ncbi:MAG: hypothetical protein JWM11_5557 [Planctomycetaceae bacterium]|nr:hypothetical protein [Planctomycetaceae bacterium]
MNRTRRTQSVLLLSLCLGCCALSLAGCEIFRNKPADVTKTEAKLPSLPVPSDALQLEVLFVERPAGDRLLGDALWNEVDTMLNLEPEEQRDLIKNGFQIGVAASHPPAALQQLLELRAKPKAGEVTSPQDSSNRLQGSRIFVRSGSETQIQLNDTPYPDFDFNVFASHNAVHADIKKYADAKCLYRVTVHREQPGWARLEFVPEIQHGLDLMRPQAGSNSWELSAQANVERLYKHKFTIVLNTGEMALVTGRGAAAGTIGHRFFTGPAGQDSVQRMLIVRLAQAGSIDNPYGAEGSIPSVTINKSH